MGLLELAWLVVTTVKVDRYWSNTEGSQGFRLPTEYIQPGNQQMLGQFQTKILIVLIQKHQIAAGYAGMDEVCSSRYAGHFPVPPYRDGRGGIAYPFGVSGDVGIGGSSPVV